MNRAERRAFGINGHEEAPMQVLTLTQEQLDANFPHLKDGDVVKINCRRRKAGGGIEPCAPGEETPLRIEVVAATAKPH